MKIYYDHHISEIEATPLELQTIFPFLTGVVKDEQRTLLLRDPDNPGANPTIFSGLVPLLQQEFADRLEIEVIDMSVDGPPAWDSTISELPELRGITLRDYQEQAIRQALQHSRGILEMGTGSGKTEIFIGILKAYLDAGAIQEALIVVGSERLLEQTRERLIERGIPEELVGLVHHGRRDLKSAITVAISNSLYKGINSRRSPVLEALRRKNLLIFDEAHHLQSESWAAIATSCPAPYRFGFSATPFTDPQGRGITDKQVIGLTGDRIFRLPAWVLIRQGVLAEPEIHIEEIESIRDPEQAGRIVKCPVSQGGKDWHEVYQLGIVENPVRNERIVQMAMRYYDLGCSVVVFVQHKAHGRALLERLHEIGYEDAIYCAGSKEVRRWYYGTIRTEKWSLEKLHEYISEQSIAICTPFMDEGVDISGINCIIYGAAGKHPRRLLQRLGRGMRLKENSAIGNKCLVIDFMDLTHNYLRKQSRERLQTYRDSNLKFAPTQPAD